ncbi:zinc-dependent metalloprotease [Catelliglobosispora koreensis]|uniref:zinc-dependent metalloprotease n=1 Tax=Catelliglobosispora koreensis TaxID=129052 RepID=UPI0004777504|nr:zinc-dependent metalloprotease [Catelliglobosispora koreensis]
MPDTPFGFALPGGQPPDPNDPQQMQQFLAGLQQLMAQSQGGSGPVNWDLARQVATTSLNSEGGDPAVTPADKAAIQEALRLADLWLEPVTALPSGVVVATAWNRNEWIYNTMDVWKKLADPVAEHMVAAMSDLIPPEARAQLGPMSTMITALGGALFGGQFGQALAKLATEVLSAGEIGLPLGPAGTAALIPANLRVYGEGLDVDPNELRLFVALREAAHQRLFGHVPWLRGHILNTVDTYARGIRVDREAIEEAMRQIDPQDPQSMQGLQLEGVFAQDDTEQQRAALRRLETALALVEGWVCHVVETSAEGRLPQVQKLAEAFRRRRAAGGPAESTFAALVGLELRPRKLREAATLWAALTEHRGVAGRDALWGHPDLLPSEEDFADPAGYAQSQLDLSELEGFGDLDANGGFKTDRDEKPGPEQAEPGEDDGGTSRP